MTAQAHDAQEQKRDGVAAGQRARHDQPNPGGAVVVIPARLASTRLPNKPLADICGLPMIVQVLRRAEEAAVGPVIVACAEEAIAAAVRAAGGQAVLTEPQLPSGSDRCNAALAEVDPEGRFDPVINLQGDLPTLDPELIRQVAGPLANRSAENSVDMATLAVEILEPQERRNPNVVKVAAGFAAAQPGATARALYFSRSPVPWPGDADDKPLYHHIGIYAFRRESLARFVALPASPLEKRERLEQLRALEAGFRIDVSLVDSLPLGVDTPADLERARSLLASA